MKNLKYIFALPFLLITLGAGAPMLAQGGYIAEPTVIIDIFDQGRKYKVAVADLVPLNLAAPPAPVATELPSRLASNLGMTGLFDF
ncbi:MAG: hypothetical protein ACRCTY_04235, partial [Candidatus Adiutrix sp.]